MITTERATVKIPGSMLARARERFPATRDMSASRVLRYTLAVALGADESEALAATRDARIGTKRTMTA